jgi:hypothetical protein
MSFKGLVDFLENFLKGEMGCGFLLGKNPFLLNFVWFVNILLLFLL